MLESENVDMQEKLAVCQQDVSFEVNYCYGAEFGYWEISGFRPGDENRWERRERREREKCSLVGYWLGQEKDLERDLPQVRQVKTKRK